LVAGIPARTLLQLAMYDFLRHCPVISKGGPTRAHRRQTSEHGLMRTEDDRQLIMPSETGNGLEHQRLVFEIEAMMSARQKSESQRSLQARVQ
jgi:hypothetical protein